MYFSIRNEKIHKLNIITCRLQVRNSVGLCHFLSPHFSFFSEFVVKFLDLNEEGMAHETTTQKIRLVPAFWPHCTFLYTLHSWCFLFYFICSHVYINSRFSWDGLCNQKADWCTETCRTRRWRASWRTERSPEGGATPLPLSPVWWATGPFATEPPHCTV